MRIVLIVQARLASARLRRKVFADLAGQPMLARVVARCRRAKSVDEVVVAIPEGAGDQPLADLCGERGWPCFRGAEEDVLDRYYGAAFAHAAGVVVRVTSDCPLIDPEIIERAIQAFRESTPAADYAANTLEPRTFPRGLDVEVIAFPALERAWREHVTPYIYRNPEQFRVVRVANDQDLSHMRWTVDTPEDLTFVRKIYDFFGHDEFSFGDVLRLLEDHPEWSEINKDVPQKEVPR